ncbi:MAG: alcohol dehydrogenase zinc-binding domain-containing protein, partial [uncultured Actinomycetospora sp.]
MRVAEVRTPGEAPVAADRGAPDASEGRVLVDLLAAPITPLDVLCAGGRSYFGVPATPYVPGVQGVGRTRDGRAVWFPTSAGMAPGDGSMAATVAVPGDVLVDLPDGADPVGVAAAGLSAVAALMAL